MTREATRLPAGYVEVSSAAASWIARRDCAEVIASGALDSLLLGPATRARSPGAGRTSAASLRLAGRPALALRAVHGGLLGRLLGGLYLGEERALTSLRCAARLRGRGIATPEVLAVGRRAVIGPFGTHTLVTREIPGGLNLFQAAGAGIDRRRLKEILRRTAAAIRSMHDSGFQHADLNVTNLVLEPGSAGGQVHIVDLDKGRFFARMGERRRFSNLARLLRSYEKWLASRVRLSQREELLFLRSYCGADDRLFRLLQARLQRYRARLGWRRLIWRTRPRRAAGARAVHRSE